MSTVPGSTPPSGRRRRRALLLLTAALVALAVFAATAFVLFRHSGGSTSASSTANRTAASPSSKSTPLLPLPPQKVVAALGKLQTKMDSPHLATQAKSWVPQLRASFMRQHELLPAGLTFDPRSLRYVNLHRHAYVTNPTHTADIEATDAAGNHYVVRLHRTPGGHWLQVAQVSGTFATLHAAAVQKGTATQAATTNAARARLLAHEDLPSVTTCPNPGTKQVIILVHGFNDSSATWGIVKDSGSMMHAVSGLPNVFLDAFDYKRYHTSWVEQRAHRARPGAADRLLLDAAADGPHGRQGHTN